MSTQEDKKKVIDKIENHFKVEIESKLLAKQIRRSNHILAQIMMIPNINDLLPDTYWVKDCFYHLNELAELIDPVLETE